jgi:hypothetical protein
MFEAVFYIVPEHMYAVTLAARFDPQDQLPSGTLLRLTTVMGCVDPEEGFDQYTHVQDQIVSTSWVRFTANVPGNPLGCTELSDWAVYLETEDADSNLTIHVDDFQLWDMTEPSGAGGAAGAESVPGGSSGAGIVAGGAEAAGGR